LIKSGRLGNNLFQLAFAKYLSCLFDNAEIIHFGIPEINLSQSADYEDFHGFEIRDEVKGHKFSADFFSKLDSKEIIFTSAWGMRKEYFVGQRNFLRTFFPTDFFIMSNKLNFDKVLCHIRGGDIWRRPFSRVKVHEDYFALPIDFYENVMKASGKPLHFLVESSTPNWYLSLLLRSLPNSSFQMSGSVVDDFKYLANAPELALSISSFSYMAGFLGDGKVYMPVGGLFNPLTRPDIDLILDKRFTTINVKVTKRYGDIRDYLKLR